MFAIYLLINENNTKTYIGFTKNLKRRIAEHRNKKTKSTKNFGIFKAYKIETAQTRAEARNREKYWKSPSGRNKIKFILNKQKQ